MKAKNVLLGKGMDRMPSLAFHMMSFMFVIRDMLVPPENKLIQFNIHEGDTVIDFGCGPGGYVMAASKLAGNTGTVYAVDVHELALRGVRNRIKKHGLSNVRPVIAQDYCCDIEDNCADVIYVLDMFHMVREPDLFLKELRRLIKNTGKAYIEDGHQSRKESRSKILGSGLWNITRETGQWMICEPV